MVCKPWRVSPLARAGARAVPPRTPQTPLKHYPRADALGKSDATILPPLAYWYYVPGTIALVMYACTRISISWLPGCSDRTAACRPFTRRRVFFFLKVKKPRVRIFVFSKNVRTGQTPGTFTLLARMRAFVVSLIPTRPRLVFRGFCRTGSEFRGCLGQIMEGESECLSPFNWYLIFEESEAWSILGGEGGGGCV